MSCAGLWLGEAELVTSARCFSSTPLSCSFLKAQNDARKALELMGGGQSPEREQG